MNKQELIDCLMKKREAAEKPSDGAGRDYDKGRYCYREYAAYDDAVYYAQQLDEPKHEKVTLPKNIGTEINKYKRLKGGFDGMIDDAFDYTFIDDDGLAFALWNYINSDSGDVIPVLVDAWRYGWKPDEDES